MATSSRAVARSRIDLSLNDMRRHTRQVHPWSSWHRHTAYATAMSRQPTCRPLAENRQDSHDQNHRDADTIKCVRVPKPRYSSNLKRGSEADEYGREDPGSL